MTLMGDRTPNAVIYKSESHKLHHSFPVKTGEKILPGQPAVLNSDGTIQGFKSGDSLNSIIGTAVLNSETPAYAASKQYGVVEATVAVSGHMIVRAASGAALTAGPIKPNGAIFQTKYTTYVQANPATEKVTAIALNEADGAGEMILVMVL
jgi:hypothetical protein